jgi:2-methylcitrate dehydratase
MTVVEEPRYSRDFQDPQKRSSANAIELSFRDGSSLPKVEIEYPLGHPRRRTEAIPMLESKFRKNLACRFAPKQHASIVELCMDQTRLENTPVHQFMERFVI